MTAHMKKMLARLIAGLVTIALVFTVVPACAPGGSISGYAADEPAPASFFEYEFMVDVYGEGIYITGIRTVYTETLTVPDTIEGHPVLSVYVNSKYISSIDVSRCVSLRELTCGDNRLKTLNVSKNSALTKLSCGTNQLMTLDVTKNPSLTELYFSNNNLTSIDVSKNPALTKLSCGNNKLMTLDVSENPALTLLYCNDNYLPESVISVLNTLGASVTKNLAGQKEGVPVCEVTFDPTGGVNYANENARNVSAGEQVGTLPVSAKDGHTFAGWYTSASGGSKVTNATKVVSYIVYYAQWTVNRYKVSFDANGGQCTTASVIRDYDTEVGTLPVATRIGYTFDGWFEVPSGGKRISEETRNVGDVTYYAHWKTNQYRVLFDANGGKTLTTNVIKYFGKKIGLLPVPTRSGYDFAGWYTAASGGKRISEETVVTAGVTYYAHWKLTGQSAQTVSAKAAPAKMSLSKLTAGKKKLKITWKKVSGVTKYEVQYRVKGKSKWTKKAAPAKSVKLTVTNLKKGKTYQVRVRAYKTVGKVKHYGNWSVIKTSKKIR